MKVILRKDAEKLGKTGDVLVVKDGYARNFLIPRGIVYEATEGSLRQLDEEKKQLEKRSEKERKSSEGIAALLEKTSVTIKMKVGEEDKLFGSVTSQMISESLAEKGITLDKRQIELDDSLKTLGIFDVPIKLAAGVQGKVKVWIVRE
jgi:large subunit ribosomal protein L9